jgi:hypothetical protein
MHWKIRWKKRFFGYDPLLLLVPIYPPLRKRRTERRTERGGGGLMRSPGPPIKAKKSSRGDGDKLASWIRSRNLPVHGADLSSVPSRDLRHAKKSEAGGGIRQGTKGERRGARATT